MHDKDDNDEGEAVLLLALLVLVRLVVVVVILIPRRRSCARLPTCNVQRTLPERQPRQYLCVLSNLAAKRSTTRVV